MLIIEGLRVTLGGVRILREISFRVPRGRTVALIGRNGAGKTTTLRAIMGLVPVAGGSILFEDRPLVPVPPHLRPARGIGYAPEDRQMITALTVEGNLLLPAQACRFAPGRAAARLDRIYGLLPELRSLRSRFAGTLSGGQQRLVALGRGVMAAGRLLLLDEPFQGIAPALAARCAAVLVALREHEPDLSILVAESNPAPLEAVPHTAYRLERGQIAIEPSAE